MDCATASIPSDAAAANKDWSVVAGRLRVCRVTEVPEDGMAAFDVEGMAVPVLVVRRGDAVKATSGICPHEVVELVDGSLDGNRVICHGHGYEFDLDTGECSTGTSLCLPVYPTVVEDGEVWIELFAGAGA